MPIPLTPDELADERARRWPGRDLDELVPRSVAYREVYEQLNRWSGEQVRLCHAESANRQLGRNDLPEMIEDAGHRAAARIAHEFHVRVGYVARAYRDALPPPPGPPAPATPADVVDVAVAGERL